MNSNVLTVYIHCLYLSMQSARGFPVVKAGWQLSAGPSDGVLNRLIGYVLRHGFVPHDYVLRDYGRTGVSMDREEESPIKARTIFPIPLMLFQQFQSRL